MFLEVANHWQKPDVEIHDLRLGLHGQCFDLHKFVHETSNFDLHATFGPRIRHLSFNFCVQETKQPTKNFVSRDRIGALLILILW